MKTTVTLFLLVAILVAGGLAVRTNREINDARTALQSTASEYTALLPTQAGLERRLAAAEAALAQAGPSPALAPRDADIARNPSGNTSAKIEASGATINTGSPAARLSPLTLLANDPAKLKEYVENFRRMLDFRGGLFKQLGFSAAEIEAWKNLAVWDLEATIDLNAAAETQGLDKNSDAFRKLMAEHVKTRQGREAGILGDRVEAFREYGRIQPLRNIAQQLAATTAYSGETVTAAQIERTTEILAATSQRNPAGPQRGVALPETVNWPAASKQLQGLLSPTQIETLGEYVQNKVMAAKVAEERQRLTAEFKAQQPH